MDRKLNMPASKETENIGFKGKYILLHCRCVIHKLLYAKSNDDSQVK